ncbi:IS3 family transposase [Defluviitalea phaphyphila]|uniref:IS3 family transposase n=1 Tax=Defluviitalea phaphyphila TaxID=1473580 RepID=UPI000A03620E
MKFYICNLVNYYFSINKNKIIKIFKENKNNYGTRKIKKTLKKDNIIISHRKIGEVMQKNSLNNLISND